MSLSTALSVASAGLKVNSRELDVTAANIANKDTVGYTKKTVSRQEHAYEGQITNVVGTGIQRKIDQAAQQQFWTETAATQYSSILTNYLNQVDQLFGQPGSANALDTLVNNFSKSLQALGASPDDKATQLEVLSKANILANQLNNTSDAVQSLRQNAEFALDEAVDDLNDHLQEIERLDKQIREISLTGEEPSGLMDQRDLLINKVSGLVNVNIDHLPNNGVRLSTGSGISLYDNSATRFEFSPNGHVSAQTDWSSDPAKRELGSIQMVSNGGTVIDVTGQNGFGGGKISGLLELRDKILPQAQAQLDELAAGMAEAFANSEKTGTAATSGAQQGFTLDLAGLQSGNNVSLSYKDTSTGETHTVTFVRVDSSASLPLSNDVTANTNDKVVGIDFSGGMASVVTQIQAELGANFTVSNPSGNVLSILDDGAAGAVDIQSMKGTFTATSLQGEAGALPFFVDSGDGNGAYTGRVDGATQETGFAGRIAVNSDLFLDPSKLVKYNSNIGAGDQTRPNALHKAFSETSYQLVYKADGEPVTMSIDKFARQIISYQSEQASDAKTRFEGQTIVMNNVQARLEQGSKVDVDTELARLLELQTAYSANARVMSAVKEMMDALLRL